MIIDDEPPAFQANPAPITGADFVSIQNRILNSNLPDAERTRLLTRANDYRDALTDAEVKLASLTESIRERAAASTQTAADNLTFLSGLYRGHADRISQESVDALGKIVVNAQANARRRIQAGEQLLWQTPARPVARRSETAVINAMDPGDAAAYMIQSRMESSPGTPANDSTLGDMEQQPGAASDRPSNESVIEAATALGLSLRTPIDDAGNPVGLGPLGGSCWHAGSLPSLSDFENSPNADYPANGVAYGVLSSPAYSQVGNAILTPQSASAPNDYMVWFALAGPDGTVGLWYSYGYDDRFYNEPIGGAVTYPTRVRGNPDWSFGRTQQGPHFVANYDGNCLVSNPDSPPPPPTSPPPPPPPTTSPPPPSEPPTANPACCPPDPAERDDLKLSKPVVPLMSRFSEADNWCRAVNAFIGTVDAGTPPTEGGEGGGGSPSSSGNPWWADVAASVSPVAGAAIQITSVLRHMKTPVVGSMVEGDVNRLVSNQQLIKDWANTQPEIAGNAGAKVAWLAATVGAAGWGERITGAPLNYLYQPFTQSLRYLVPTNIPGQSDADSMWLADRIDDAEWECLTRSNGNIAPLHRKARDSKVTLLNPNDYVELFMRDQLTFPELRSKLRPLGIVSDDVISEMIELRVQIPQFADIIRFMVRDTENAQVVSEGRLDDGFEVNFTGVLEQWARQQGLDSSVALRYWRAHWELPSPTMAFEMLRRLRPGRVPDEIAVTYDQVQRLLSAADYAPGWREKMTAVSYLTPTRTDIKQGYSRGVYDRPTIIEMLQDTGLDRAGAEAVAKLYDFEKEQFQRTRTERASAFTVKTVLAGYIAGTLNRREAEFLLDGFGFSPERKKTTLDSADLRSVMDTRSKCIRAVRRRYYVGAIDEPTAVKELMDRDIDQGQAEELVNGWNCERSANLQEVPARKNLQWAVDGVITILELEARLKRLRYSADDIARYAAEAEKRISDAVARAIEKQVRDMLAEQRRRLAEAKAKLKDFEDRIKEAEKKAREAEKKAGGG